MEVTDPSPTSKALAALNMTREDLKRHTQSMRSFLRRSESPLQAKATSRSASRATARTEPDESEASEREVLHSNRAVSHHDIHPGSSRDGRLGRDVRKTTLDMFMKKRGVPPPEDDDEELAHALPPLVETHPPRLHNRSRSDLRRIASSPIAEHRQTRGLPAHRVTHQAFITTPHAPRHPLAASSPIHMPESGPSSPASRASPMDDPGTPFSQLPQRAYPPNIVSSPVAPSSPADASSGLSFQTHGGPRSMAKPPFSYAALIGQAILSSPNKRLSLNQIYTFISFAYPYYQRGEAGWQNSIRHNLSLNSCFVKIKRDDGEKGKGSWWTIKKEDEICFAGGGFSRRGTAAPPSRKRKSRAKPKFDHQEEEQDFDPYSDGSRKRFKTDIQPTPRQYSYQPYPLDIRSEPVAYRSMGYSASLSQESLSGTSSHVTPRPLLASRLPIDVSTPMPSFKRYQMLDDDTTSRDDSSPPPSSPTPGLSSPDLENLYDVEDAENEAPQVPDLSACYHSSSSPFSSSPPPILPLDVLENASQNENTSFDEGNGFRVKKSRQVQPSLSQGELSRIESSSRVVEYMVSPPNRAGSPHPQTPILTANEFLTRLRDPSSGKKRQFPTSSSPHTSAPRNGINPSPQTSPFARPLSPPRRPVFPPGQVPVTPPPRRDKGKAKATPDIDFSDYLQLSPARTPLSHRALHMPPSPANSDLSQYKLNPGSASPSRTLSSTSSILPSLSGPPDPLDPSANLADELARLSGPEAPTTPRRGEGMFESTLLYSSPDIPSPSQWTKLY